MKYHPHGSVLFITCSLEEGLLLLANPLREAIIKSCLARAQSRYRLRICHFLIEATHMHLIVVVDNPDDVKDFLKYFKTESAHMLNNVLGREKRTVWCEGYDSPVVLTPTRALIAISYTYSNPAKDNLETSIDNYPGLSSWKMFRDGAHKRTWRGLTRPQFVELARDSHCLRGYTKEAERILRNSNKSFEFAITPSAWLEAFNITGPKEQARWNERLVARIRTLEERAQQKRQKAGRSVIGRQRLINQKIDTSYRPRRSGRRMWCLCEKRELRTAFIEFFKRLKDEARAVRKRWSLGDFAVPYPLGLYPPSMPKLAEPLSMW